jgi:predicted membrane-bound spermidine synthase
MSTEASTTLNAAFRPWLLSSPVILILQASISAAGLVVEIIAGRMLAPYVGMSIYSWTAIIAVVLAGFSVGHWIGGLLAERPREQSMGLIALAMGLAAATTAMTLPILRLVSGPIMSAAADPGLAILLLATVVVFLPSFFAGMPSPVLAKAIVDLQPKRAGKALGAIFAAGSIGAIAGTLAAGFLFVAWLGSTLTLLVVTLAYALSAVVLWAMGGNRKHGVAVVLSIAAALAVTAYNVRLGAVCTEESRYYCIRIVDFSGEIGTSAKLMVLDHLGHGINLEDHPEELVTPYVALIDRFVQRRFDGVPDSSFFIGGGAYTLPRAWRAASRKGAITVSEIDPEVTRLATEQMWLPASGLDIIHDDARVTLRESEARFDVIVGDAFTDIAAPAHLVTREFFQLVKTRLGKDGLYAMNVVDHVPDMPALLAVYRTLASVFDQVEIFAEEGDFLSGGRTTFVLFASGTPSGLDHLADRNGQIFARIAPAMLDRLIAERSPPLLTDDYAPIDRLVGIGEL